MRIFPLAIFLSAELDLANLPWEDIVPLDLPILVDAAHIQKSKAMEEIFRAVPGDQLRLISQDVDHKLSALHGAISYAQKQGLSHLIVVSQWNHNLPEAFKELVVQTNSAPTKTWLVHQKPEDHWLRRMEARMGTEEPFSAKLKQYSLAFPIAHLDLSSFRKASVLDYRRIILKAIREDQLATLKVNGPWQMPGYRFWERVKLHSYDLILLTYANLQDSGRPWHSTLSMAMGVFLACSPFYGLQSGLILLAALIFRLNFPVAFLGAQVSLPPVYPLIVALEVYVGQMVLGHESKIGETWLETAQLNGWAWFVGSLVVGAVLSFAIGVGWYWLITRRSPRPESF